MIKVCLFQREWEKSTTFHLQKHRNSPCLQWLCSFSYWVYTFTAYIWSQPTVCVPKKQSFPCPACLGTARKLPGSSGLVPSISPSTHHIQHLSMSISEGQGEDTSRSRSRFNGETMGTGKSCLHFQINHPGAHQDSQEPKCALLVPPLHSSVLMPCRQTWRGMERGQECWAFLTPGSPMSQCDPNKKMRRQWREKTTGHNSKGKNAKYLLTIGIVLILHRRMRKAYFPWYL